MKKNLYSAEIRSAYQNLRSVYTVHEPKEIAFSMVSDAFSSFTQKRIVSFDDINELSYEEEMLYHSLVVDASLPLRIVFGYYGFKSEYELRKSFISYLEEHTLQNNKSNGKGFGITSLPNLIICNSNALIKTNGMPYALIPENEYESYILYGSYSHNPILLLLELIWTRLSRMYSISCTIFGEDLDLQNISPLLSAKIDKYGDHIGWAYKYFEIEKDILASIPKEIDWEPEFLSKDEFIIINLLCNGEKIKIEDLNIYVNIDDVDVFLKQLCSHNLVGIKEQHLLLISHNCVAGILPDGRFIAGENNSGRLDRWIKKYMASRK